MISETRIKEAMQYIYDEFLVNNVDVKYELCEDAYLALQELLSLRQQVKEWRINASRLATELEVLHDSQYPEYSTTVLRALKIYNELVEKYKEAG